MYCNRKRVAPDAPWIRGKWAAVHPQLPTQDLTDARRGLSPSPCCSAVRWHSESHWLGPAGAESKGLAGSAPLIVSTGPVASSGKSKMTGPSRVSLALCTRGTGARAASVHSLVIQSWIKCSAWLPAAHLWPVESTTFITGPDMLLLIRSVQSSEGAIT